SFAEELTERETAEVYRWIAEQFPRETDPDHRDDGVYLVSARDSVATFRDSLLRRLQERGTSAAVDAIAWLSKQIPDLHLKWILVEVKKLARTRAWKPFTPREALRTL